jgi:Mrr N-terminal domain
MLTARVVEPNESMDNKMDQQLANWRSSLVSEVAGLEQQIGHLNETLASKREKIAALDKLLGANEGEAVRANVRQADNVTEKLLGDVDDSIFTPVRAYWRPILLTLVELGGRGRREKVIEIVGGKMQSILLPADRGRLPKSNHTRWKNRVAWQVSNMKSEGLVKKDGRRGVWEITDSGRKWLDDSD